MEEKNKDVLALTNAITDIIIEVTDKEMAELGLKKGVLNDKEIVYSNREFLDMIADEKSLTLVPGGSSANVAHGVAVLGLKSGLIGTVGNDNIGKNYRRDIRKIGLEDFLTMKKGTQSGVCYIFVTPDKEKTPIPDLRVSKEFNLKAEFFEDYKLFHTSGYEMITNPGQVLWAMKYAKEQGMKLSFDLADPSIPVKRRADTDMAVSLTDYLTLTEDELKAYTGLELKDGAEKIREKVVGPEVIAVKKGGKGSEIITKDAHIPINRCPVQVVDTTGAGDAYMAGMLSGILRGWNIEYCGNIGSYIAGQVCALEGARLPKPRVKRI